ncbi:MAG: alginate export family protein [Thermoanaerobaculales bacterium]|jgi:hypothetical protein|nr:alginate export family protein [Thermoanaerobaculales bacterium]
MPIQRQHPLAATLAGAILAAAFATPVAADDSSDRFLDAVSRGDFSLNLRYRYEDVDQEGFDESGRASTLRTVAAYRTLWWKGLQVYLEVEDVHDLGLSSEHNNTGAGSLGNGVADRPVIADPPLTEFNQAYLGWKPMSSLPIRLGLQEVVIDNARFVGNVGWRQNHQTFEAARVDFTGIDDLVLSYSFIDRQHTVTGDSQPMSTSHLGVGYTFGGIGTLKGYALLLDFDNPGRATLNSTTFGASFGGTTKLSETLDLGYRLELAHQTDTNNPVRIDADYLRGDLSLTVSRFTFAAAYEVLGGSPEDGQLNTPLATLHGFNGWADKFLVTPSFGLRDLFGSVGATIGRFKLTAVYHDFSADTGGAAWGTELDAEIAYTTPWKQQLALKYAGYDADEHATDTTKLWLYTTWGF